MPYDVEISGVVSSLDHLLIRSLSYG